MDKEIKPKKVKNTKPKVKGSAVVKPHNAGKVNSKKATKASNMPSNYGVR
jgi:hypothetical protein